MFEIDIKAFFGDTLFVQRFLFPFYLIAICSLTAIFLGPFAKPAVADTTGFLSLINSYRQQNNLGTLVEDQNLTNAACWLAADLEKNGFKHTDSLGRNMSQRLTDFGVTGGSRAENIFSTTSGSSANYAFDAWKNSPGHNANMLGAAYTRIGIGRANVSGKWYWTTDFASGTATALTSQCGVPINPTPITPKPAAPAVKPTPIPAPIVVQAPPTEVVVATPSASETNLVVATKSASISAKVIDINDNQPKQESVGESLVKGSFLTISFIGYLILFEFIFWRLFHHFRLPPIEHEEEI